MSPWARLDDSFCMNRKVKQAWRQHRASLGLHALALSYCAGQLTDGVVDRGVVAEWMPNGPQGRAAVAALVDAGLWGVHSEGWIIHDWLDYNPSAQETRAKRRADADRQAEYRARRHAVTNSVSNAVTNSAPTRPDPLKKEQAERKTESGRTPGRRIGGPSHDEANEAGLSWAALKAERLRQGHREGGDPDG